MDAWELKAIGRRPKNGILGPGGRVPNPARYKVDKDSFLLHLPGVP